MRAFRRAGCTQTSPPAVATCFWTIAGNPLTDCVMVAANSGFVPAGTRRRAVLRATPPRAALLCLLAATFVVTGSCGKARGPGSATALALSPTTFKAAPVLLSEAWARKPLEAPFVLENRSSEQYEIAIEHISCGCLTVRLPDEGKELKPGDVFRLPQRRQKRLQLHFRPTPRPGWYSHCVEVVSTAQDGAREHHAMTAQMLVVQDLVVVPPVISVAFPLRSGKSVDRDLRIERTVRAGDPPVGQPQFGAMPAEVELLEVVELPGEQSADDLRTSIWRARVRIRTPSELVGAVSATVGLRFADGQASFIPVTIVSRSGVEVLPRKLELGVLAAGTRVRRRVLLLSLDHLPFEITRIAGDAAGLSGATGPAGAGERHWLEVTHAATSGEFTGNLAIYTTHPEAPRIVLEVHGVVR